MSFSTAVQNSNQSHFRESDRDSNILSHSQGIKDKVDLVDPISPFSIDLAGKYLQCKETSTREVPLTMKGDESEEERKIHCEDLKSGRIRGD